MTQRDNILQELRELQSSLADAGFQNVYQVPGGYFDGLAEQVLNRIKVLNTEDAAEELSYLSPLLSGISKQMPYSVPAGFFDELTESVIASIKIEGQTAAEELEELSPLLSGLKKDMPFSVPKDYFEKLDSSINKQEVKPVTKVVSITSQRWFRYAAAAVVIGFVAMGGLLIFNSREATGDPGRIVNKMMKKVSTEEIDNFVQLTDESQVVAVINSRSEIKDKNEIEELIKDVPEKDIENFLKETETGETGNNDEGVITN